MMRRTYRSKKDTGGGLDHRDMLFNMDEKSSAFDAFYIQNIKQTKREQSCMGSSNNYGAASNRVRKRKYVKRLVKEVEPPPTESHRDSISGSVFLTPDKSLRVNKAPDLFDQLLNSSPACSNIKQIKKVDLFDNLLAGTPKEPKTYNRKKKLIKKFNYSSDDSSVSDKENTNKNNEYSTQNTTDIKAHELIVEKEATPSPQFDESINNIVRKLSLINNIKHKNSITLKKTFNCNKNRLTKNFQSPISKTSPLSSTPFSQKSRSQSIYKFSPIPMGNFEESPNYVTITEDDDDINKSVVFVPKNNSNELKRSQNEDTPVKDVEIGYGSKCKGNSNPLFSSEADTQEDLLKNAEVSDKTPPKNADSKDPNCIQLSSLQISEVEPFLGFSNETIAKVNKNLIIEEEKDDSIIISSGKTSKITHKSKEINFDDNGSINDNSKNENKNTSIIEYSIPPEPFFGFTKQSDSIINITVGDDTLPSKPFLGFTDIEVDKNETVDNDVHKTHITDLDKTKNNSVFHITTSQNISCRELKEYTPESHSPVVSDDDDHQISRKVDSDEEQNNSDVLNYTESYKDTHKDDKTVDSDDDDDSDHQISQKNVETDNDYNSSLSSFSSQSQHNDKNISERSTEEEYDNKKSLYDTCNSESSFCDENSHKEPVVALEKMDMNLFKKYYKNMPEEDSAEEREEEEEEEIVNKTDTKPGASSRKPIVAIEKMNIDLFKKYYEDMPNYDDEIQENTADLSEEISVSYASLEDSDYDADEQSEQSSQSTYAEKDLTSTESDLDCTNQDTSSESRDRSIGEKCVSFVTTRRRNEPTNKSDILVLDDSQESTSTECDKTVISNNKVSLTSPKNIDEEINSTNIPTEEISINIDASNSKSPDTRVSNITMRKSTLCRASNAYNDISISKTPNLKPAIILQPGKKWERSLSIYRRMTMNDHFEHSMLEDEDLHSKGRKYRQSVIETMEMQDKSSLHNESIHNRRSTFVSKPSRSTIRIVKETNTSRLSLSSTAIFEDLKGFLEDCDDTIVELSKLSLVDDHDVTVIEKFHEASRIATARDYVLRRCNQSDTIPFDECYPDPLLKNCRKIGEGVYGEVFLWRAPDGRARVMKVVPIAGTVKVNGEQQKDFHEIIAEIVIAMELSALRAPIAEIDRHFSEGKDVDELDLHAVENATDVFNEVLAVRCVYGSYPSRLLDLWELYDETKGSENDNPAILPVDQQYIVLELANAGQDLESYQFNSAEQAHALFLQVAFALAVGEEAFQFEHRDLHWGNVLIAPTDQKYATFVLRGRAHRVARCGVAGTIIDYSLSRVALPLGAGGAGGAGGADAAQLYNDLAADDGLFGAVGDYQFEVYRLMRDKLGNDWKNFEPYTNILWLHYTADKMITALRYKRTNTKTHKQFINKLKGIKERILGYGSAAQFVLTDNEF